MDLPATRDIIVLADGTELDERQSQAVILRVLEDATYDEIAEQVGYAAGTSVRRFLDSSMGREAVRLTLMQHLNEAARIGLQTMIKLAKSAKSENVRQLAAADLLNRARIQLDEQGDRGPRRTGEGFTINISVGDERKGITIDGTAIE